MSTISTSSITNMGTLTTISTSDISLGSVGTLTNINYPNNNLGTIWSSYANKTYSTEPYYILTSKYKFNFDNEIYNTTLSERIDEIKENEIIFNIKQSDDYRIEPLDTINMLLEEMTILKISKYRDEKEVCNIILKNFKFVKVNNLLSFTNKLTVNFTYDTITYDNPNIPKQEKRNVKLTKIMK